MAYEHMTYEVILNRMLSKVLESHPDVDTREGSLIYSACATGALELAIAYTEVDNTLNESFVSTASREYLMLKCKEIGIDTEIFNATYGEHEAHFNVEIPIGTRWNCDIFNYEVIEYIDEYIVADGDYTETLYRYRLRCETSGSEPNSLVGDLTPINYIPSGLYYAKLVECLYYGENEATDDRVRESYINKVKNVNNDGNISQYEIWCDEYGGIGNYKVIPLWNGANTVKVSILDNNNDLAPQKLVDDFQEYLDPGVTGMGDGVAPIGAFVTVTTATEVPLSISGDVTLEDGYDDTSILNEGLVKYFKEIAYKKDILSYMQIGSAILDIDGVGFITNLKINGSTNDITLTDEQIPTLGETNWSVV
jgi:uncharacterized phage protein gp47/JayE